MIFAGWFVYRVCHALTLSPYLQIDSPGKALLLAISLFYVGVVLVVPTANVFYQVSACSRIHHGGRLTILAHVAMMTFCRGSIDTKLVRHP